MLTTYDKEEKLQIMRQIIVRNGVLLDIHEEEVGLWEVRLEDSNIFVRNIVTEDGELTTVPWLVCQVNTYDGRIFEVPVREVDPNDSLIEVYGELVGQLELWW